MRVKARLEGVGKNLIRLPLRRGFSLAGDGGALSAGPTLLEFRILGSFESCDEGISALGGPKQRALLAASLGSCIAARRFRVSA